jgi:hypothetical protein
MFPTFLHNLKFGIREVPAFEGHSFADKDKEIVDLLRHFLTKLGGEVRFGIETRTKRCKRKGQSTDLCS